MEIPKRITIKKIPLYNFLALLNNLYMDGAEFVDLHGEIDPKGTQDTITVSVPIEYLSDDARAALEAPEEPPLQEMEMVVVEEEEEVFTEEFILKLLNNL